jgi:predicted glycogen debranching enzyme
MAAGAPSRAPTVVDKDGPHGDAPVQEWLVTNGLGGYASGTITGAITRRFHGVLVAALDSPLGRTMMLNHLAERVTQVDGSLRLDEQRLPSGDVPLAPLIDFRLEQGLPVWRYDLGGGRVLEKRIAMPHHQNTAVVRYALSGGTGSIDLELTPWVNFRPHEGALDRPLAGPYSVLASEGRFEVSSAEGYPPLRLFVEAPSSNFFLDHQILRGVEYVTESRRGYEASGDLYSPGFFRVRLEVGLAVMLSVSTESWPVLRALSGEEVFAFELARRQRLLDSALPSLREGFAADLVLAADAFVIHAKGRVANAARAMAQGDQSRTVVAGYHWFTDWGRDTMISLEGLTLCTGRHAEARYILRTFSHSVRDGLIPNMFPEGNTGGVYYTADATLWFFHALSRYVAYTSDERTVELLLPVLVDIAEHHFRGTCYGIGVDPGDGLLRQGSPDHPLTWMDAKVGDYIITPRRGKPVEINALFYNALVLLSHWLRRFDGERAARPFEERAEHLAATFNERFYFAAGGYLYDVIDGEMGADTSLRPNQLLAISLPHPVLSRDKWVGVMAKVEEHLVTPLGLRSLAASHPDYKAQYFGDLRARDLAYHQGTVWAWLIGPFVDAWLKLHPDGERAESFLTAFQSRMNEACVGSISEIFDAEPPYRPRGCIAQAWSVAEVLRLLALPRAGRGVSHQHPIGGGTRDK